MIPMLFPEGESLRRSTQLPHQCCQHHQRCQHGALLLEGRCPLPGDAEVRGACNRQGRNQE